MTIAQERKMKFALVLYTLCVFLIPLFPVDPNPLWYNLPCDVYGLLL